MVNRNFHFFVVVIVFTTIVGYLMFKSDSSTLIESEGEKLSECQNYYKNIFPNAPIFGTFEEHHVADFYSGRIASVDETSGAVAKRFYTHHKNALEKNGVNFAGRYSISSWGFTGIGDMFAVIDAETGHVYPFPYVVDWDFDFRKDSNLLVINPIGSMPNFGEGSDYDCETEKYKNIRTYYFLFNEGKFIQLGTPDLTGLRTSEWLSN
jgi:hypothetical protein